MKPTQVKLALEIVEEALELDDPELEFYLDRVCADDLPLRREVLSYLEYDQPHTVVNDRPQGTSWPEIPDATTDRYELGDEIARGGMGVVLRAFDNNLRRPVAVKILKRKAENDPDIVRRFLLEAHIGGQLQHPGIAPVYEIGRLADGRPSIAMKLVNGATLQTLLKQRQDMADDQAKFLGIFEQVCQAIAFAHRRGVIHRDLKPANVMVGEFGEVQVMDWGIAKLLGDDETIPAETATVIKHEPTGTASEATIHETTTADGGSQVDSGGFAGRTRMGVIMGTPAYMPPEQAVGRSDRMSDVFSLGAMLCEILTGEPTAGDLVAARDRLDRCGADNELCELAKSCIEQNPTDRPADAGVVATRLSDYLNAIQSRLQEAEIATARAEVRASEERRRRQRTLWTIGGFAILLLMSGVVIAVFRHSFHQRSLLERSVATVAALSVSRGVLVPRAIEDLRQFPSGMVLPELRRQFGAADEDQRLQLACGLAEYGDVRIDDLVSRIESSSPDELENFVAAFDRANAASVNALENAASIADAEKNWRFKARLAMLAFRLEAPRLARETCQLKPDPIQRTWLIEESATWHGDLIALAGQVTDIEDNSLRSAIALAAGSVPLADVLASEKAEWEYACRAGTTTKYSHGDDVKLLNRCAVYNADSKELPGSKLPNAWGLFDPHGNAADGSTRPTDCRGLPF